MTIQKKWGFGLGTIFTLIAAYFIFLYAKERGWALLAFLSKWYLIIAAVTIALPLLVILLIIAFSMIIFLVAWLKMKPLRKRHKNKNAKDYIEAEYTIKE